MLCPKCGTENGEGAKFCKGCGTSLASSDVAQPQGASESEQAKGKEAKGETPESEDVKAKDADVVDAKPVVPLATEPAANKVSKGADAKAKLASMPKKTKLIIGGVAAVAVIAIVAVVLLMNNGPSDSTIEEFVRQSGVEQSVPASEDWENKDGFTVQSVKVLEKTKSDGGTQSAIVMGVQMSDPYTAKIEAVLSNGSKEVTEQATMYLAKVNGEWSPLFFSKSSFSVVSVNLIKGVDHKKVTKHMETILHDVKITGKRALGFIYEKGNFKVVKDDFNADKKTDTLTIECTANNPCYEASGTVTATFKYGDNGWEFESAKEDKNLEDISYQKLVGTWTGKIDEIEPYSGMCYGGKANPVKLNITNVDDQSGKVEGTVTALMHFHEESEDAEDTDPDDTVVADIPFSVEFDLKRDYASQSDSFDYKRDDDSEGTIRIELDDDGIMVNVKSEFTGGSKAFSWATFYDTFTMTKDN